jgi:hypothetical protein
MRYWHSRFDPFAVLAKQVWVYVSLVGAKGGFILSWESITAHPLADHVWVVTRHSLVVDDDVVVCFSLLIGRCEMAVLGLNVVELVALVGDSSINAAELCGWPRAC